jgi:cold shock CspA family protein
MRSHNPPTGTNIGLGVVFRNAYWGSLASKADIKPRGRQVFQRRAWIWFHYFRRRRQGRLVHITAVQAAGYTTLRPGQRIIFELAPDKTGKPLRAAGLRLLN